MQRLIAVSSRRARQEEGAVTTLFAVLIAAGVTMGMLALSVDVGAIMLERRHLQNGADATALALADACARDDDECNPANNDDYLGPLLDRNSGSDAVSQFDDSRGDTVNGQCGRGVDSMTTCASSATDAEITDLAECPPVPTWLKDASAIPYVETYSRTETADGTSVLPKIFSQLLTGGGSDVSVTACARAAWGAPSGYSASVPLTFSTCEWEKQTSGGTDYVSDQPVGEKPGYGGSGKPAWPDSSREVTIVLHDPKKEDADCTWNGKDTAGGFGWVDGDGDCSADVSTHGWAQIDPGNNLPSGCDDKLADMIGAVVSLPVFDCIVSQNQEPTGDVPESASCDPTQKESSGKNTWYHVAGWAKFYLSGYHLSGGAGDHVRGSATCTGEARCITGWFLKGALDADQIVVPDPDNNFGTYAVLPAG